MRLARLTDFDYIGLHAYFLTICTAGRTPFFKDARSVDAARGHFLPTATAYGFEVVAYCFMPDHLHGLVAATRADADFKRFVAMFKQRCAFAHRRRTGTVLWQENYYEHVLRSDENYPAIVGYILGNPLRAGLVRAVGEYPFMGSERYSLEMLSDFVQSAKLPWE